MEENTNNDEVVEEQPLSKKERGRIRKEEKKLAIEKELGKKKAKKALIWIIVIFVIIGAIYGMVILSKKSGETRAGEPISILGRNHVSVGAEHEEYNSNPPTSGSHYSQPANWGIYDEPLPDERVIHNLEHGGIWISYKNLDESSITELEDIQRKFPGRVILTPREENDSNIAIASWGRLMKLDSVDKDLIEIYIKKNTNRSPEQLAQ